MLQMGRETQRKKRRETARERERERSMGRGQTRVNDTEGMRREKAKGRKKVRKFTMRERRHQKIVFLMVTNEDNIYRRCNT